ncbi:MAG: oxidoreductase, partial [Clostridiales bacterium]|nr:oxidoreductase [Clostridiales bacterium]
MERKHKVCMYLPPFAGDYSGVCSALFDLGGMICIHDAAGCTGNYTHFDEPRWYGSHSMVFCTGFRKVDAVLGDDEKLIGKIVKNALLYHPKFIAIVGSPVPNVIGFDFKGVA